VCLGGWLVCSELNAVSDQKTKRKNGKKWGKKMFGLIKQQLCRWWRGWWSQQAVLSSLVRLRTLAVLRIKNKCCPINAHKIFFIF
jgi:hypothetical protein